MRKTFIILLFVCAFSLVTRAEKTFTASSSHPNPLQRHIEAVAEAFYQYALYESERQYAIVNSEIGQEQGLTLSDSGSFGERVVRMEEADEKGIETLSNSFGLKKCSCFLSICYNVDANGVEVVTISRDPLKRQECRYSLQSAQSIQTDQSGESTYEMVSRLNFRMDEFMIHLFRREDNDGFSVRYAFSGQGQKKL